ncbi:MAG: hypothetical protein ACK4UN_12000 [Limisphaerales bacterium]
MMLLPSETEVKMKSRVPVVVSGRNSERFDFDLTFDGRATNWARPLTNQMGYVATIFENRRGNQFVVVTKRTE